MPTTYTTNRGNIMKVEIRTIYNYTEPGDVVEVDTLEQAYDLAKTRNNTEVVMLLKRKDDKTVEIYAADSGEVQLMNEVESDSERHDFGEPSVKGVEHFYRMDACATELPNGRFGS